jgi:hypothetical protein
MNSTEIVMSKKLVYIIAIGLVLLTAFLAFGGRLSILGSRQPDHTSGADLVAGSQEKFAFLSGQGSQRSVGST